jgi:ABC-type multidrug transport system ATPase subunit
MKQRVGIAQALLNDPELLIVDEPTVGLDPEERARFRNLLSELAGNRIVILSTHIVSDVEAIAEQIAILHEGNLLTNVTPTELLTSVEGKVWKMTIDSGRLAEIRNSYQVTSSSHRSGGTSVRVIADNRPGAHAEQAVPNMEDAYLWFMQRHKADQKTLK